MGKLVSVLVLLATLAAVARADTSEWRVGAGVGGIVLNADVGGASGTGLGYEARGRLSFGLSNAFDLNLIANYARASDVAFDGALLDGQTGRLYADFSMVNLAAELRWTPGLGLARALERTSPYLAARAGVELLVRTSQQLFAPGSLLILGAADDLALRPGAGGALGVEHRFGDHLSVAAELGATWTRDATLFDFTAEATWAWY